jgi:glycosyltransferase involved in cell wall biosynthesis
VSDTLQALSLQTAAPGSFEVLVIDNNSKDSKALKDLVATLNERTGNFLFFTEPKPGLNEVRQAGAEYASAPFVLYLDDDAVPLCSYVERMAYAVAQYSPDVIGGSLLPFPMVAIGRQFDHTFAGWWSLRHYGPRDRWLNPGEYFLGSNIGARRSILQNHGFDRTKDRKGSALLGGGELWLGNSRLRRWYCASAPVFHKVSEERMSAEYLTRRMLANLSKDRAVASWSDVARAFACAVYSPLKTAFIQIHFRLGLALSVITSKLKARRLPL